MEDKAFELEEGEEGNSSFFYNLGAFRLLGCAIPTALQ